MFILNIFLFLLRATIFCVALMFLLLLCKTLIRLINHIKKHIVWLFANQIRDITVFPGQEHYRQDVVETGFSTRPYSFRSAPIYHYRYQTVYDGTYHKLLITFKNNFKLKIIAREEGPLYQKLIRS